jgi:alkanesulfonate monooxygenase SsuD/methylene tetrahydromethanopterin reductase-like flavin-dependent oxidoreductase (luciferase family)
VRISLSATSYTWAGGPEGLAGELAQLARRIDELGVDTLWVPDHLLQMDPNAASIDEPMLEAYTTLGFLAAVTQRLRLGTLVTWTSIREPAVLVKAVTTLDVLSGGRAWLGAGVGYRGDEAERLGLPFPATADRFACLEELLELADRMWRRDASRYEGPRHVFAEPIANPAPVRRPRVLIGGMGERRTLPLVARHADACNLFDVPDGGATLRRKLDVLAAACHEVGRDPDEVEVTLTSRLAEGETADQLIERCAGLSAQGVDHLVLITAGPWSTPDLDLIAAATAPVAALP